MPSEEVKLGLLGLGTVGSGVVRLLNQHADSYACKSGMPLRLTHVASRSIDTKPHPPLPGVRLSPDPWQVVNDDEVDIVLELIGGTDPARTLVLSALARGKAVVTANKALLAQHGADVFAAAERHAAQLGFEASVAAGIPIIRTLREGFAADRNTVLFGIVNGTCNYILSTMSGEGAEFAPVLQKAQALGLAEADPSMDVDGTDAAQKLTLLIMLAFGVRVSSDDVYTEGIRRLDQIDFAYADEFGYAIKLLAIAKQEDGVLEARVHPTMIPRHSLLASVSGAYNAIFTWGEALGSSLQFGQGAGGLPTAAAVLSDVVDIVRTRLRAPGRSTPVASTPPTPLGWAWSDLKPAKLRPMDELVSEYYLRFMAVDSPGVLTQISGVLGARDISIASVIQRGRSSGDDTVPLVMRTHAAPERSMKHALRLVDRLPVVHGRSVCIRIEESLGRSEASSRGAEDPGW